MWCKKLRVSSMMYFLVCKPASKCIFVALIHGCRFLLPTGIIDVQWVQWTCVQRMWWLRAWWRRYEIACGELTALGHLRLWWHIQSLRWWIDFFNKLCCIPLCDICDGCYQEQFATVRSRWIDHWIRVISVELSQTAHTRVRWVVQRVLGGFVRSAEVSVPLNG